jgi:hypothetical protein
MRRLISVLIRVPRRVAHPLILVVGTYTAYKYTLEEVLINSFIKQHGRKWENNGIWVIQRDGSGFKFERVAKEVDSCRRDYQFDWRNALFPTYIIVHDDLTH